MAGPGGRGLATVSSSVAPVCQRIPIRTLAWSGSGSRVTSAIRVRSSRLRSLLLVAGASYLVEFDIRGAMFRRLLLLDQGIIAGLGNIYVCEALYRAGIHPRRAGGSVSLERLKREVAELKRANAILATHLTITGPDLKIINGP